jgi:V-type H+-transporting ATPase subunit H
MSLDPPAYLAQLQNNIRQRPIAWEGAVRTGTLTEDQLAKIRAVDKARKDARKETVEADLDGYRLLFVGEPGNPSVLELASRRQEIVQYILVLLNDLLQSMLLRLLPIACFIATLYAPSSSPHLPFLDSIS